ncbi:hypothetical protein TNCV_1477341 [Trichonephila clavipes]|nr:hypothetical protein TNCV_1477341 [Trichonephila clavipes]
MVMRLHPNTVQNQATIKKGKYLTLKENPPTQRFIVSKLGMSSSTEMVKVTDSGLACHEFETGTTQDTPCKRGRCTLILSRLKHPHIGVLRNSEEEMPVQVSSSSLDYGSKLRDMSPKALSSRIVRR